MCEQVVCANRFLLGEHVHVHVHRNVLVAASSGEDLSKASSCDNNQATVHTATLIIQISWDQAKHQEN